MKVAKRKNEEETDAEPPKKTKLSEDSSISAVSDNEINWKLLHGYLLWLNVINRSHDMYSTKLFQPVEQLIQKIHLENLTNVWFNSKLLFEFLKLKTSLTIAQATSYEPKVGGKAYRTASLEHFDIETIIEELDSDCLDSDSEYESDGQGILKHVVKVVHIEQCPIEKMIGSSSRESEIYNSLLGLKHTSTSEIGYSDGWIINPQWINVCSANMN